MEDFQSENTIWQFTQPINEMTRKRVPLGYYRISFCFSPGIYFRVPWGLLGYGDFKVFRMP